MKTVISSPEDIQSRVAAHIAARVREKPDSVLIVSPEEYMSGIWAEAAAMADFSRVKVFSAVSIEDDPRYENALLSQLSKTGIKRENINLISRENAEIYDKMILTAGGTDVAVVSIGQNGRFAFNEPGTQYDTLSHVQKLTRPTLRELGLDEKATVYAATVGVKTVVSADDILVAAFGEEYAKAVFNMLYARDDSIIPAAFLQLPRNVTVYADDSAASKL